MRVAGHRAVGIGFVYITSIFACALRIILRVPPQRRLAISRLRVPNLDGFVIAAAGNLFSIGTPHHRKDPEIVRSPDTNEQKQRGENLREKKLGKKNVPARVPGHCRLAVTKRN